MGDTKSDGRALIEPRPRPPDFRHNGMSRIYVFDDPHARGWGRGHTGSVDASMTGAPRGRVVLATGDSGMGGGEGCWAGGGG